MVIVRINDYECVVELLFYAPFYCSFKKLLWPLRSPKGAENRAG